MKHIFLLFMCCTLMACRTKQLAESHRSEATADKSAEALSLRQGSIQQGSRLTIRIDSLIYSGTPTLAPGSTIPEPQEPAAPKAQAPGNHRTAVKMMGITITAKDSVQAQAEEINATNAHEAAHTIREDSVAATSTPVAPELAKSTADILANVAAITVLVAFLFLWLRRR